MTADQETRTTLHEENQHLRARIAELEAERDEARLAYQQMYEVLMQSPAPIFLLRGDNLAYELANPAYLQMVQKSDVIGKPVREVFPELEDQGYFDVLEALYKNGEGMVQQEFPAQIDRGDTGELEQGWFNLVYQPIQNTQGQVDGILHLVVEVTDLVRARHQVEALNEALQKNRNLLQSIVDNAPSIIYAKDLEGHVILANQAFAEFTHLEPAALIGKTDYDYFPPETAEHVRAFDQQVLADGMLVRKEDCIPTDNGPLVYDTVKFPIRDEDGTIYALGGISTDITEQKRQEEDLRTFQAVIDAAPDGISFARLDTGQISYANPTYRAMFGYGDDIIGLSLGDVHPEDPEHMAQLMQTSIEQGVLRSEISCIRKDGSSFPAELAGLILHNAEGQPSVAAGILRDLSEQQQKEKELQTFKTMADTAPDGFGIADKDGVLTYANDAYRAMTGYGDKLVGMRFIDHFDEEEQPQAIEAITETSTRGEWRGLLHFQRKDGSHIPVESTGFVTRDDQGNITSVMGLFRDKTEQQRQEKELRIFKALVENAPDGVCVVSPTDFAISYTNHAYQTMVQYDSHELVGMHGNALIDIDAAQFQAIGEQMLTEGAWQGFIPCRRKDGSTVATAQSLFVIRDQQENVQTVAVIARDITEQQRIEQEREALQQRVIEAQRETLRELSTPLIPISERVVIMPLIGSIDSQRSQMVMEALLEGVAQHQAALVILDITGVQVVDTQVAQTFIQAAQAVRLLGAQVMLTGIQPQIAQTLVQLGVDLSGIITRGSLQAGIADALQSRQ
jgi:rsbT co-antagonist protein RsbR